MFTCQRARFEVFSDFSILVLSLDFVKAYHFFPFRLFVVGEENLIIFSRRVNSFYFIFCQSFLTTTDKTETKPSQPKCERASQLVTHQRQRNSNQHSFRRTEEVHRTTLSRFCWVPRCERNMLRHLEWIVKRYT